MVEDQQEPLRSELTAAARRVAERGLVVGPGGNLSARTPTGILISPSGSDLGDLAPEEWIEVDLEGGTWTGPGRPSSELPMHLGIYRAVPAALTVVHTHPPYCIALGSVRQSLPVLFPDHAALVGQVGFVEYQLPTTEAMGQAVASELTRFTAVLLENHGLVTIGNSLREAMYRTEIVEAAAMIYLLGAGVATPRSLSDDEVAALQGLEAEAYRISLLQD